MKSFIVRLSLALLLFVTPVFAGTGAPFTAQMVQGISSPQEFTGLAAWYDVADTSSIIKDGSNRVQLIADKSGNSSANVLALNGVAGNYASSPDSAAVSITGDIDIRVKLSCPDWTPSAQGTIIAKRLVASGSASWQFLLNTNGRLQWSWSTAGPGFTDAISTAAPTVSDFGDLWVRVTFDVDNGASGNTATFYTSTDGSNWTLLGSPVVTAGATSIFDGTDSVYIGTLGTTTNPLAANFYRAQIYSGINGTLAFDANFATAAKLATSFTESSSNAATVTINTTGDLGARICGARDLVMMTASKQPVYLPFGGTNYGYTNGVSGTYFSTPDSPTLDLNGNLELRYYGALADWTPSAINTLVAKSGAFLLGINTSGQPRFVWVDSGSGIRSLTCNASVSFSDGALGGVKVEFNVATGTATFYTSTDFSTWSQLGAAQVFGATSIINSTGLGEVNATNAGTTERANGRAYRAQFVSGIGGTVVADFNPALYTSGTTFTASTGEIWTLSGGSTIVTRTCLYFDGTDDYMKAASFALAQPETVYFCGSQVSWTGNDYVFDGNTNDLMTLYQQPSTPSLRLYAGIDAAANTGLAVSTNGIIAAIFNGASSALRISRGTATTGNAGASNANGFTLGARGTAGTANGNITTSEIIVYSAAHTTAQQNSVIGYLARKWSISGGFAFTPVIQPSRSPDIAPWRREDELIAA